MKQKKFFPILLCLVCLLFLATGIQAADKLMAGTAKTNITPPNPRYPVHDSLYARSLILEVGTMRVAFIAFDSGSGDDAFITSMKKKYNLQELYLCQSHNHSGAQGPKEWTEAKFDALLDVASKNMFEAIFSGGHRSFPSLAFNRLIVREDGRARESWTADDQFRYINSERLPHGPVDNSVGVVRIDDKNGNPRVLIMNYACHPDVIWNNFEVSGDYVGYATKYTEEAFDNKVNCLFVNGAAGNQAPLFKDGGRKGPDDPRKANYDLIERMGKLLGIETVKLAKQLYPNPYDENSLKVKTDSIAFTGRFNQTARFNPRFSLLVVNNRYVFSIVPGEFFIKFQLDWKKELAPYDVVPFFYGYTSLGGGRAGYVPDIRSAALGGYGADQGAGMIEVGAGERVMARQLENYYRVTGLMLPQPSQGVHRLDDGTVIP